MQSNNFLKFTATLPKHLNNTQTQSLTETETQTTVSQQQEQEQEQQQQQQPQQQQQQQQQQQTQTNNNNNNNVQETILNESEEPNIYLPSSGSTGQPRSSQQNFSKEFSEKTCGDQNKPPYPQSPGILIEVLETQTQ
jgi:acyl-coenzyme A synthetase/AMP-(fatty) acid ligase